LHLPPLFFKVLQHLEIWIAVDAITSAEIKGVFVFPNHKMSTLPAPSIRLISETFNLLLVFVILEKVAQYLLDLLI